MSNRTSSLESENLEANNGHSITEHHWDAHDAEQAAQDDADDAGELGQEFGAHELTLEQNNIVRL